MRGLSRKQQAVVERMAEDDDAAERRDYSAAHAPLPGIAS
jgi:hypothetical protein